MEDIARVNQRFMQAVRSGDRAAFVALYTEDAVIMQPGRSALGRAESLRADGTALGTGKYIVVWKRSDRGWRIHRDIMNPDA